MSPATARSALRRARIPIRPGTPADDALPLLMREYGGMVHAVARRIVGTVAEADDIVQETFIAAYRTWKNFRGDSDPGTWLYRIAVRAAGRALRRKRRRREKTWSSDDVMPFSEPKLAHVPDDPRTPEGKALQAEAREELNEAISQLPTSFRLAVVLKDIAELPLEDISHILGLKVATVKTRIHRGRFMLRAALLADTKRVHVPPAVYERRMCMDLLRAKMEALDHGVAFPVQDELVCERCRTVFASLDLGFDACRHAARDAELAPEVRRLVLAEVARESGSAAAKKKHRRRAS